jgi:hypothetical protein
MIRLEDLIFLRGSSGFTIRFIINHPRPTPLWRSEADRQLPIFRCIGGGGISLAGAST